MSVDYTQQKLWQAVSSLICAGELSERIHHATMNLAPLHGNRPGFPAYPELQSRLETLLDRLNEKPTTEKAGEELASEMLSLLLEATRLARTPVGASETSAPTKRQLQ